MRRDRGSVLLLFPAGVLVVLLLGAIAVDASIAFLGQREIANAVAAAANDAATASLSDAAFYGSGDIALDQARATDLAEARVRGALDPTRFHDLTVDVRVVRQLCTRAPSPARPARATSLRARPYLPLRRSRAPA